MAVAASPPGLLPSSLSPPLLPPSSRPLLVPFLFPHRAAHGSLCLCQVRLRTHDVRNQRRQYNTRAGLRWWRSRASSERSLLLLHSRSHAPRTARQVSTLHPLVSSVCAFCSAPLLAPALALLLPTERRPKCFPWRGWQGAWDPRRHVEVAQQGAWCQQLSCVWPCLCRERMLLQASRRRRKQRQRRRGTTLVLRCLPRLVSASAGRSCELLAARGLLTAPSERASEHYRERVEVRASEHCRRA